MNDPNQPVNQLDMDIINIISLKNPWNKSLKYEALRLKLVDKNTKVRAPSEFKFDTLFPYFNNINFFIKPLHDPWCSNALLGFKIVK